MRCKLTTNQILSLQFRLLKCNLILLKHALNKMFSIFCGVIVIKAGYRLAFLLTVGKLLLVQMYLTVPKE